MFYTAVSKTKYKYRNTHEETCSTFSKIYFVSITTKILYC